MLKGESLEMMAGMGEDEGEGYGDGDGDGEEKTIIMVDIRAISPAKTLRLLSSRIRSLVFTPASSSSSSRLRY